MKEIFAKTKREFSNTPLHVIIVGIILSITFFLLFVDFSKQYRSEILISVLPKSEASSIQKENVLNTVAQLPTTLAFYNQLRQTHTDIVDIANGKTLDQRKSKWNQSIDVIADEKNSTLKLHLYAKNQNDSMKLANYSAQTLFLQASKLYNLKDEVSLVIIDQPIVKPTVFSWPLLLALSLILGLALALLIEKALLLVENSLRETQKTKKQQMMHKQFESMRDSYFTESKFEPIEKPQDLYAPHEHAEPPVMPKKEEKEFEYEYEYELELLRRRGRSEYPNFPEMPTDHPKSSVPGNLPVADEGAYPFSEGREKRKNEEDEEKIEEEVQTAKETEPTQEEYKKRLNKLLRGE